MPIFWTLKRSIFSWHVSFRLKNIILSCLYATNSNQILHTILYWVNTDIKEEKINNSIQFNYLKMVGTPSHHPKRFRLKNIILSCLDLTNSNQILYTILYWMNTDKKKSNSIQFNIVKLRSDPKPYKKWGIIFLGGESPKSFS